MLFLHYIDEKETNEASTCGKILIFLSWVLVFLTMPFSLLVCFKVSSPLDLLLYINHLVCLEASFCSRRVNATNERGKWILNEIIYEHDAREMLSRFLGKKKISKTVMYSKETHKKNVS